MAVSANVTVEDGVYVFNIIGSPTTNDCALPILQYRSIAGYDSNVYSLYEYVERNYSTLIGPTKWYLYPLDYRSEKTGTPYDINLYGVGWATGDVKAALKQIQLETYSFVKAALVGSANASDYYSNFYMSPTTEPLATPTGLYADNITSDSATTHWTGDENASNYKVQYKAAGDTVWTETYTD